MNFEIRFFRQALRDGDTGIGYTFETLVGIKENNDQKADFNGIEIKCKGVKEGRFASSGKINIFQSGPVWLAATTAKERIKQLGKPGADGLYACHSQVTTIENNLRLMLQILNASSKIDLVKDTSALGFWPFDQLEKRLLEKHSRAAFIKAQVRERRNKTQYWYEEFIYCNQPSIDRFVDLVSQRKIVFEFLMHEQSNGSIRNRGYPWRLIRGDLLDQLFAFQIKLR